MPKCRGHIKCTENTNLMLKTIVSKRKKGYIFINAARDKLSMAWFKDRINHYAKLLGIQKEVHKKYPLLCPW